MTIRIFELEGCADANLAAVHGSLVQVTGCTIFRTAKGAFILGVDADSVTDAQVEAFLAPLHVRPDRAFELPGIGSTYKS